MNPWIKAGSLALLLIIGVAVGWTLGKRLHLHSPNLPASLVILLCGSLGGPVVTYRLIGTSFVSFATAAFVAGVAVGVVFWPMGKNQSERQQP